MAWRRSSEETFSDSFAAYHPTAATATGQFVQRDHVHAHGMYPGHQAPSSGAGRLSFLVWTTVVRWVIDEGMKRSRPTAVHTRSFDSAEQEVFLNLWRTYDRLRALEDELFGRHDLTAQQYNALRLLRAAHPDGMATLQLAGRLISRAPDITRLLVKLENRGLVRRERPAANRRVVQVVITPAGLDLLDAMADDVRDCARRQLGHLDAADQERLIGLLRAARAPHEDPASGW